MARGESLRVYNLRDRILGSLISAGIGDALGAPVEGFSRQEIHQEFGRVKEFKDASRNVISPDNNIAEITDDTSQLVEMARAVVRCNGDLQVSDAAQALINWSNNWPKYYPRNAGTTTRFVITALKDGQDPVRVGMQGKCNYRGATNGAVMRVASAGLVHPGDLEGAIETAISMTTPSHGTQHGFAGACAIACAIAEALKESADVWSIVRAARYGASRGNAFGMTHGRVAAGPAVERRIQQAFEIALACTSMEAAEIKLQREIGLDNISVQATVGAVIGLFVAADGDTMRTLESCANIGGDTDTFGCVAGMIAGAFNGCAAIPAAVYQKFCRANPHVEFETLADGLYKIAVGNKSRREPGI